MQQNNSALFYIYAAKEDRQMNNAENKHLNNTENKWNLSLNNLVLPLIFLGVFWGIAILLSIKTDTVFYYVLDCNDFCFIPRESLWHTDYKITELFVNTYALFRCFKKLHPDLPYLRLRLTLKNVLTAASAKKCAPWT